MPTDRVHHPNQQEQTRYRQVNQCHHPSKLHEGRRWIELNREIFRCAKPLLLEGHRWDREHGREDQAAAPVGGGKAWPGFEIDHSEPLGSRVAISRAGRRPRAHQAARPSKASPSGARNTAGEHSNKHNNGGASHQPVPPLKPLHEEPRHTLTAWRPRS